MPPLELRARRRRPRTAGPTRRRPARSTSCCRTADRSTRPGCSPGCGRARSPASRSRPTRRSPARCGSPAVRRGSSSASTRSAACGCGRALTHLGDLSTLVTRARRLFDLDADPIAVDEALARHAELAPLVAAVPGIRVPGAADPHEMLIRAMVGQQITVSAARTALTRARRARSASGSTASTARPCSSRRWRRSPSTGTRCSAARPRASAPSIGAAAALADGTLPLGAGDDAAEQRAALLAMPGIGPVDRRLRPHARDRRPRRVPARATSPCAPAPRQPASRPMPRALTAWAARTAPWRSYLTAHLWRAVPRVPQLRLGRPSRRRAPATTPTAARARSRGRSHDTHPRRRPR